MMWRLYVVSSASTRSSPGSARLIAAMNASKSTAPSCSGKVSWRGWYQCDQNGRLRATRFSHVRLCDSFTPNDVALASGVRSSDEAMPWAYRPWPASCMVDQNDSIPVGR